MRDGKRAQAIILVIKTSCDCDPDNDNENDNDAIIESLLLEEC